MGAAKITTDHDEIRTWVEERGGTPAHVRHTSDVASGRGILRIDFPGVDAEESLEMLEWDDWFRAFDAHRLAFLHEDDDDTGDDRRFNKIVSRDCIGSALREGRDTWREESFEGPRLSPRRPSARRMRV
ncbi:MAG: hypothetical protein QM778_19505 [Myxococcales bacterium]